MFKRKKPSSATTSTNSVASPSSAATSAVSKKQQFNNVPEPKKKFPPREFRKKKITKCLFQKNQSVAHPQIHYYETHDSAFCHVCVQAYHRSCICDNNIEPQQTSEGYSNQKDATYKGRGFKGHKLSKGHKEAIERNFILPTCTEDVGETLSSEQSARKSVNRQALLKILSNVRLWNGRRYSYEETKQVKSTLTLINCTIYEQKTTLS